MARFLLVVALLTAIFSARASETDNVSLQGGVCNDSPMTIGQTSKVSGGKTFIFEAECKTLGTDNKAYHGMDRPPTEFACLPSGKSVLAGATYKKIRNSITKSANEGQVPDRDYTYKCAKGCTKAPMVVSYYVGDCG